MNAARYFMRREEDEEKAEILKAEIRFDLCPSVFKLSKPS